MSASWHSPGRRGVALRLFRWLSVGSVLEATRADILGSQEAERNCDKEPRVHRPGVPTGGAGPDHLRDPLAPSRRYPGGGTRPVTADRHDVAEADRRFRLWMRRNLDRAAAHFGLTVTGEPILGWRDRSISAVGSGAQGCRWLRVVSEQVQWAQGHAWTGNADANAVNGLPKPHVLDVHEWAEGEWRRQRAEVMTVLPGVACSPTDTAVGQPDLDEDWWKSLRTSLRRLAGTPTDRVSIDQDKVDRRVRAAFGEGVEVRIHHWETLHGDLHWANLHTPLAIVDWELWGRGPVGTDAATLHSYSLAVPELARRVREEFPVLDTPDGKQAQLYVAARLLHRIELGDHPHLAGPLRDHVRTLLRGGR